METQTNTEFTCDLAEGESVTRTVIDAVADLSEVPPVPNYRNRDDTDSLDPLYTAIDPEALDSLFSGENVPDAVRLEFTYQGYEITVRGDGFLSVVEA